MIVQGTGDKEQCLVYYFTHQRNQTVMQLAEVEMGPDGKLICNRNKYAPATQPTGRKSWKKAIKVQFDQKFY